MSAAKVRKLADLLCVGKPVDFDAIAKEVAPEAEPSEVRKALDGVAFENGGIWYKVWE